MWPWQRGALTSVCVLMPVAGDTTWGELGYGKIAMIGDGPGVCGVYRVGRPVGLVG